jgi:hypothetical protein
MTGCSSKRHEAFAKAIATIAKENAISPTFLPPN